MTKPRCALVTGSAGFIGFHLCQRLLAEGWKVIGIDALTDYYDVALKKARQALLLEHPSFCTETARIETPGMLEALFATHRPDTVIHLAGQVGVRYSIKNPESYVEAIQRCGANARRPRSSAPASNASASNPSPAQHADCPKPVGRHRRAAAVRY